MALPGPWSGEVRGLESEWLASLVDPSESFRSAAAATHGCTAMGQAWGLRCLLGAYVGG